MEDVDLVQRDQVDVAEHVVDGEEVAGDVEHRPAVVEARPVADLGPADRPRPGLHRPSPRRWRGASGAASSALGRGRPAWPASMRTPAESTRKRVALGAESSDGRGGEDDVAARRDRRPRGGRSRSNGATTRAKRSATAVTAGSSATTTMRLAGGQFEGLARQRLVGDRRRDDAVGHGGASCDRRSRWRHDDIVVVVSGGHRGRAPRMASANRRAHRCGRAERVGFEPTDHLAAVTSLAGRRVRPDSATSPNVRPMVSAPARRPRRRRRRTGDVARVSKISICFTNVAI